MELMDAVSWLKREAYLLRRLQKSRPWLIPVWLLFHRQFGTTLAKVHRMLQVWAFLHDHQLLFFDVNSEIYRLFGRFLAHPSTGIWKLRNNFSRQRLHSRNLRKECSAWIIKRSFRYLKCILYPHVWATEVIRTFTSILFWLL